MDTFMIIAAILLIGGISYLGVRLCKKGDTTVLTKSGGSGKSGAKKVKNLETT